MGLSYDWAMRLARVHVVYLGQNPPAPKPSRVSQDFSGKMVIGGKESWSAAKKKLKRKRVKEVECIDSLPWTNSITIGDEYDERTLLDEIDEADYNLPLPTIESGKLQNSKYVESHKIKEKNNVKKAEMEQDSSADSMIDISSLAELSCDVENKVEELDNEEVLNHEFSKWSLMRLHPLLMKSICKLGFKEPTPIQEACFLDAAFKGKDVIGAAETGSGKTLAYGLPILQRLLDEREKVGKLYALKGEEAQKYPADGYLRALIITPTNLLALQVTKHLNNVAENLGIRVVPIVGDMSSEKQERLLKRKPEIVVATPGRLWELMSAGEKHLVELHYLSFFVLDEADSLIEIDHFEELQSIMDLLPVTDRPNDMKKKRQTFVFSATLALSLDFHKKLKHGSSKSIQSSSSEVNSIEFLSKRAGMRDNFAFIDLTTASILAPKVVESFIKCGVEENDAYLYYILSVHRRGRTIVFCTSIAALRHICALSQILGLDVFKIFSEMKQGDCIKAKERFCASENGILVATDGVAMGTDVENVRTVIHYQLPHTAKTYIHRCGRAARASAEGCSIALISPNDTSKFYTLCKSLSKESVKMFPVDGSYMPALRKRLSLARQIDQIQQKVSRVRAGRTWVEKYAKLMELELDNEESEEERVDKVRQRKATSAQLTKLKEELRSLLSRTMQPSSGRYFAGVNVVPHNCIEPLQALRAGGKELMIMKGQSADKRRDIANLRKKRKEEKIGRRDQRRNQKKKRKLAY